MAAMALAGAVVEARDRTGAWLEGKIVGQRGEGDSMELRIHFYGWNDRFDEWIKADSDKIRPRQGPDPPVQDIKVGEWDKWDGYIEEDIWAVDKVLKKRKRGGMIQYFCRFEGGHGDDDWVDEEDVGLQAIEEYEAAAKCGEPYVLSVNLHISLEMAEDLVTEWREDIGRKCAVLLSRQTTEEFASRKVFSMSPYPAWLFVALHRSLHSFCSTALAGACRALLE